MASIKPYIVATIIAGNFPNVFHASEQRQSQEDISKTNTSALGTDVNLGDTVHSKAKTFLSKINATCALEAKLGLRLLLNRTGQSLSEMEIWTTIDHYSTQYRNEKLQTDPLPVVLLEITDGRFICPYFFNELSIDDSWPNGRKIIYKSGIFNDDNIQNILRQRNLGKNGVLIKNWVNLWSQGKLLFFITYNKKLFCLVPESEANKLIDIKLKAWYTSSTKKAVFVLAGTTVIVAAASVVKTLMGPKLNILPQPRSLPITAATEPSVAMNVASFRDYSSPASDGHSKYNFDYRVFKDHRTFQDEHRQVIFAGATHLSYRCYDYANRTISLKKYQKNYFKAMLDLKYDLDVAENQCNWAAKEIIARELLEIIGGKYGSTEAYAQGNTSEMQAMIDYQDMVTLHAATAALEMAIQRKSMEICKSHLKLTDEDLCKVYADNSRCSMALDTPLEEYLKKLNMVLPGSFEIDEPLLLGTPRVKDIIALAKLLCNPKLLEVALSTIAYPDIIHNHAPQDRSLYIKAITHLIDTYFKIPPGKEFLKKIATNYFIKIYDRIEHFLEFAKPQVKLKLRDCNGKDIFGNKNVCSYNATLELIRREPTNKNFIATGGMFKHADINRILGLDPDDLTRSYSFRRFNENGTEISDRDIEDYNAQIREIVNKYRKTGSLDVSFWPQKGYLKVTGDFDKVPFAVRIPNEDGAKLRELIEKKNKYDQEMHPSFFFINFTPTNDLSSRIRAHISYLVFAANINHWMKNNGLFPLNLEICIDQNVEKRIEHFYNPSIDKTEIDHYWSTPLKLLVNKFYKNNVFSERVRKEKIDHIFRALGISLAYFSNDLKRSQKVFFNEITMENKDDGAFQDLSLLCIYIANPFSGIIGQAGFNGHGRLILQY